MSFTPAALTRTGVLACAVSLIATAATVAPAWAATTIVRPAPRPVSVPAQAPTPNSIPARHATRAAAVTAFSVLHSFTGTDGSTPSGTILEDLNGNIYGTTENGGAAGSGTVYKASPSGTVTTLHAFTGADGASPVGGLLNLFGTIDLFGPLYGVTQSGGANNAGTVYQITTAGAFNTLHAFTGADGNNPSGRLVRFIDGNLYGTTSGGGASNNGTIFKLTPSGTLTTLHAFTGGADGGNPVAGLSPSVSGWNINGNLFGVTTSGGVFGAGVVFSISPSGAFTTLYNLAPNTDGSSPSASLIPDFNGNLYGTTAFGGSGQAGTVFKVTTAGKFTLLYSFPSDPVTGLNPKGAVPLARLSLQFNGNIYGTAEFGGDNGGGVVFKIANGAYSVLHSFNGTDGQSPRGQLIADFSGNLYGTATSGGSTGSGTLFVLPQ